MIARIWRGAVGIADGDAYAEYMDETGIAGYTSTPGNRGAWMLRRDVDDKTEFLMFTCGIRWRRSRRSRERPEVAVFYPEDDRFLVEREETVSHYDVDQVRCGRDRAGRRDGRRRVLDGAGKSAARHVRAVARALAPSPCVLSADRERRRRGVRRPLLSGFAPLDCRPTTCSCSRGRSATSSLSCSSRT